MQEFQKEIVAFAKAWEKKRGVTPTAEDIFIHLTEEIGELAREYVNKKERPGDYSAEKLEDSVGDALMQLVRLADIHNLDIEKVVKKIIREQGVS